MILDRTELGSHDVGTRRQLRKLRSHLGFDLGFDIQEEMFVATAIAQRNRQRNVPLQWESAYSFALGLMANVTEAMFHVTSSQLCVPLWHPPPPPPAPPIPHVKWDSLTNVYVERVSLQLSLEWLQYNQSIWPVMGRRQKFADD